MQPHPTPLRMPVAVLVLLAATVTACRGDDPDARPLATQPIAATGAETTPASTESDPPGSPPTTGATCVPLSTAAAGQCHTVVYQGPDGLHLVAPNGLDDAAWRPAGVPGRGNHPDWSPDGQRLAFVADDSTGTTDLWIANADGSGAAKLVDCVSPCSFVEEPAWSPDGTQIAYWSSRDTYTDELRIVDVASGATVRAIRSPEWTGVSHPRWSPDGSRISADTGVYDADGELTSMGVGIYSLEESAPLPVVVTGADSPANFADWSPDGSAIAYQGGNALPFDGGPRSDIYISGPDGSNPRRLTDADATGLSYALPSWSADGQQLFVTVIHAAGDYRIAQIDVATGEVEELADSAGAPITGAHAVQCCG